MIELPLNSETARSFRFQLDGRSYRCRQTWNDVAGWWTLDLFRSSGEAILEGLVVNAETFLNYSPIDRDFPYLLYAIDRSDSFDDPGVDDLGSRVVVVVYRWDELAAMVERIDEQREEAASSDPYITRNWTPLDTESATNELWVDTAIDGAISGSGDTLTIFDQGDGAVPLSAGAGTTPTVVTIDDTDAVQLDGGDYLETASLTGATTFTERTLVLVAQLPAPTGSGLRMLFTTSGHGSAGGVGYDASPYDLELRNDDGAAISGYPNESTSYPTTDEWHIFVFDNTTIQLYLDGELVIDLDDAAQSNLFMGDPTDGLTVGGDTASEHAPMTFRALQFFDGSLSTEERQRIEGYYAHELGIESSLPDAHPYRLEPPITEAE